MPVVDVAPTLSLWSKDDVAGSTNDFCLARDGAVNEAGDAVVLAAFPDGLHVLLIRRVFPPFAGGLALPGGFRDAGEDIAQAVSRELLEETGIGPESVKGSFSLGFVESTAWDPRFVAASVGGRAFVVTPDVGIEAGDDASAVSWVRVRDLASGSVPLAFGHAEWLARTFAPDSPFHDPAWFESFSVLSAAARVRNREIVRLANGVRSLSGHSLIPLDEDEAALDAAVVSAALREAASQAQGVRVQGARSDRVAAVFEAPEPEFARGMEIDRPK